jgi:acetyl esterase/lipase
MAAIARAQVATMPATTKSVSVLPDSPTAKVIDLWPANSPTTRAAASQPFDEETVVDRPAKDFPHNRSIRKVSHPTLTVYLPDHPNAAHTALIVCPGGGYSGLAIDKEGYPIAEKLNAAGIAAIVLKYRLPYGKPPGENELPMPLQDVHRSVRLVRSNADEWKIDPAHVGVIGFSAGGHVAGMSATQFDTGDPVALDPIDRISCRPDFVVLMYAVSTMHDPLVHAGSRRNLLGEHPSDALEDRFSTEKRITPQTPPLLMVHAKDDKVVKIENTYQVAEAAKKSGIPCDTIIFNTGGHGFGLGPPGSECSAWFDQFLAWLRKGKFLD